MGKTLFQCNPELVLSCATFAAERHRKMHLKTILFSQETVQAQFEEIQALKVANEELKRRANGVDVFKASVTNKLEELREKDDAHQAAIDRLQMSGVVSKLVWSYNKCKETTHFLVHHHLTHVLFNCVPFKLLTQSPCVSGEHFFLVSLSGFSVPVVPDSPIIWDRVIADRGENYNPILGAYTAPENGYYQ